MKGLLLLLQQAGKWLDTDRKLLKMSDEVDYDVEAYAKQLDLLLGKKIDALSKLRGKLITVANSSKTLLFELLGK